MSGLSQAINFLASNKNNITFGLCIVLMIISFTIVVKPETMASPGLLYANTIFTLVASAVIFAANVVKTL